MLPSRPDEDFSAVWHLLLLSARASGDLLEPLGDLPEVHPPGSELPRLLPIVGGQPAEEGEWPDTAAVANAGTVNCTGVLVAPDLVLTAGHCGWGITHVILDSTNYLANGETVAVEHTVVHPDYLTTFDVALVFLARETTVPPRQIAPDCLLDDFLVDGAPVALTGYGATDLAAQETGSALNVAYTDVRDADCDQLQAGCNGAVSPGGELVAGGDGVDSCSGDSGGPLYLLTPHGDFLLGITSRAAAPAETLCGDGGIYVRADAVVDWIEATSGRTLVRPECPNRVPKPTVETLVLSGGVSGNTRIDPHDPDAQAHTFTVLEPASHGIAVLGETTGLVSYWAPPGFVGADRIRVQVTDDGDPPLSAELDVPFQVVAAEARGTCDLGGTTPGRALPLAALLLCLLRRR